MANSAGTIEKLLLEASKALQVLSGVLTPNFLSELGIQLPASVAGDPGLVQKFNAASQQLNSLPALAQGLTQKIQDEDIPGIIQAAEALSSGIKQLVTSFENMANAMSSLAASLPPTDRDALQAFATNFVKIVVDYCIITYLESRSKLAVHGLALLGLIEWRRTEADPASPFSTDFTLKKIRFDRLSRFTGNPEDIFHEVYEWGDAAFDGGRLFEVIKDLVEEGIAGVADLITIDNQLPILEAYLFALQAKAALNPPGLNFEIRVPFGNPIDFTTETPLFFPWVHTFKVQGQTPSNLIGEVAHPSSVSLSVANGPVTLDLSSELSTAQATEPLSLLSLTSSSHVTAKNFVFNTALSTSLDANTGKLSVLPTVKLRLDDVQVSMDVAKSDSFVQETLPSDDIASQFSLGAGWDFSHGFVFEGSGGLEIRIPAHAQLGVAELNNIYIRVQLDPNLQLEASAAVHASLGPLSIVIDRIGFTTDVLFRDDNNGRVGPIDLDFAFKPPSGLGLSVDGGGFKGGGVLDFEPEQQSYSGMLELEFQDQFTLKAFGLLTTRLPNGQSGFSLLIVISSEFTPIQLGFGFKLNGVGGLLGLNRTVKVEPLRAGLRDNTLGSILFPTDVVANADRILSDLKQVFPPQGGRFLFGPMAKITWGTPTLVSIDLGLVIEIPDPLRLLILGIVRAIVPDEQAAILRIQVNFLGEVNFEKEQISFDASLFDSRLLAFTLSGDMAVRIYWGADANLLLTAGGFHPAYQPPPMNLPALRRLTLALLAGDNPRLTLEMYFAITSNTVQLGARVELYAAAWEFNVYGFLSFDVLFQFNPFYFIAEITAMLALRVGSSSIASIKLTLSLEGPTPWKAQGTAQFKICWFFTLKVRFNKTFGESRNTTLPDVAVLPLLVEALSAADNWEGELPAGKHRLESLKEVEDADLLLVHPLGAIKVSQKVVPLNVRIDRVGSQRPSDTREFHIEESVPAATADQAQESFAPEQFFDMNDEEKLGSPSFKNFDSGIRIGEAEQVHTGYAAAREVRYELKYIDSARDQRLASQGGLFDVDVTVFNGWRLQGAISKTDLSFARRRKSSLAPEEVAVVQEPFAIVNTGDLKPFDGTSILGTERAALARIAALIESNPALKGTIQSVPVFEMNP
jgi:hypothetical protein